MNPGIMQGRSTTVRLPAGGYIAGISDAGMGPYSGHDPLLSRANPYAGGAGQAGALGVGGAVGGSGAQIWGPGGGTGGTLAALGVAGAFQGAYNSARDANLQRYGEIDKGYSDLASKSDAIIQDLANGVTAGLDTEWKNQGIAALAPFKKNLGPNRSSVTAQVARNTAEGKSIATAKALAEVARIKLQGLGFYKDRYDFQERRNDPYPDASRMDRLLSAGGDADGGGGGAPSNPAGATPGVGGYGGAGSPYAPMQPVNPRVTKGNPGGLTLGQLRNRKALTAKVASQVGAAVPGLIGGAINQGVAAASGLLGKVFNTPYRPRAAGSAPVPVAVNTSPWGTYGFNAPKPSGRQEL